MKCRGYLDAPPFPGRMKNPTIPLSARRSHNTPAIQLLNSNSQLARGVSAQNISFYGINALSLKHVNENVFVIKPRELPLANIPVAFKFKIIKHNFK